MTYKIITVSKKANDLAGQRFGRLTAMHPVSKKYGAIFWLCKCKCGSESVVRGSGLKSGMTQSCGCWKRESAAARMTKLLTIHGMCETSEYSIWKAMRKRCTNKNDKYYFLYGGRGITVCKRWDDFANFYTDMGLKPTQGHSIDRIDSYGNYEKSNCRWATTKEQARNKRNNRMVSFKGQTLCVAEWSEITGIHKSTLTSRMNKGWSAERVFAPVER
jgi:hypothetical protein